MPNVGIPNHKNSPNNMPSGNKHLAQKSGLKGPLFIPIQSEDFIRSFVGQSVELEHSNKLHHKDHGAEGPSKGKSYFLHGTDSAIFRLSLLACSIIISKRNPTFSHRSSGGDNSPYSVQQTTQHILQQYPHLAVVDGCNRFDIRPIVRYGERRNIFPVDLLLARVFVSRAFTCYQMEATMVHQLPEFLQYTRARHVMVFGLLDTMYDEQAPFREVQAMLPRILQSVDKMKHEGISFLFTSHLYTVEPKERNQLFTTLKRHMDHVFRLTTNEMQEVKLYLETPPSPSASTFDGRISSLSQLSHDIRRLHRN